VPEHYRERKFKAILKNKRKNFIFERQKTIIKNNIRLKLYDYEAPVPEYMDGIGLRNSLDKAMRKRTVQRRWTGCCSGNCCLMMGWADILNFRLIRICVSNRKITHTEENELSSPSSKKLKLNFSSNGFG